MTPPSRAASVLVMDAGNSTSTGRRSSRISRVKQAARRLAGSLAAAVSRYSRSGASDSAAAIAYRVLFSLAPLTVALVSVFGLLLRGNQKLKHEVIDTIIAVLPIKSESVAKAIENIATPASAAGLVSVLVLIWAASGMMTSIRFALERTMNIEDDRGVARGKLIDLALVCAAAVLLLVSVGVGMITQLVDSLVADVAHSVGVQGNVPKAVLAKLLQLLLLTGTALLVYRAVPAKRPRLLDALAGAVLTAFLLEVLSLAAGLVYSSVIRWSFIYGSVTSVFVFLYSVYLFASVLLLGAAFASEWSRPHQDDAKSMPAKARRTIRGLLHRDNSSRSGSR